MCLFALVLVTIFIQLGMAHWNFVLLTIKGNQNWWSARAKDELMMNVLHEIRLDRQPGKGHFTYGDEAMNYDYLRDVNNDMTAEMITARVRDREHWPQMVGIWITAGDQRLFVADYWRE